MLARPVHRYLALLAWAGACATAPACGGGRRGGGAPLPAEVEADSSAPVDEEHALPELVLEGVVHRPAELTPPPMLEVRRGRVGLAVARRATAARRSPVDAQLFASLAWREADARQATRPAEARALRGEARDALARVRAVAGPRVDPVTLQMLATAALAIGDDAQAADVLGELIRRFAERADAGVETARAWLAVLHLRGGRPREAVAAAAGPLASLTAARAYALAWAALAARDGAQARAAIEVAWSRWADPATRAVIDRDLLFVLARSGATAADAAATIARASAANPGARAALLAGLADAYEAAGAFDQAAAALDLIAAEGGPGAPTAAALVALRFRQADHHFRLAEPARAAARAIEAHAGLAACAAACAGDTAEAVIKRLAMLAQFSHGVFAATHDPEHLVAARTLYAAYLAVPGRADRAAIARHRDDLEGVARETGRTTSHGARLVGDLVRVRRESLTACYEAALIAAPALTGPIALSLEVSSDGEVLGAATDPGAGADGLAAVAGCVQERVRAWRFPRRVTPGTTRVQVPLALRPRAIQ